MMRLGLKAKTRPVNITIASKNMEVISFDCKKNKRTVNFNILESQSLNNISQEKLTQEIKKIIKKIDHIKFYNLPNLP